ncbi:MAG TPA: DUF2167 domain-containing protein [Xanthomonadales bacterium]|nr:DUF2167 domain-containing protein [Xanthomonadales bacterium]
MSIVLLWVASIFCWLWLVVRVSRASGTLPAVLAFVVWPIAIIDVIKHWKDEANSVAWPYFATLIATVALYTFALRGFNEFVAEQDARLSKAAGGSMQQFVDEDDPISDEIRLRQAIEGMEVRRGEVSIPEAHAKLDIPEHFRLVPRRSLDAVAVQLGGEATDPNVFGWLVHDSVHLLDDDAWFIEVTYTPIGHVAAGDAEDLAGEDLVEANREITAQYSGGEYTFASFAHVPAWREDIGTLAWGERLKYSDEPEPLIDCYAAKPTRAGVITFLAEYMPEGRSELCLRSVRLMAARTHFDPDWSWHDYSFWRDPRSGSELADLVTGAAFE